MFNTDLNDTSVRGDAKQPRLPRILQLRQQLWVAFPSPNIQTNFHSICQLSPRHVSRLSHHTTPHLTSTPYWN